MRGWMYILECVDGSYYTGSTIDLERRFLQHLNGDGAITPKKDYQWSLFILKNIQELISHFTVRSKFNVGEERKKKPLLVVNIRNYHSWLREPQPTYKREPQLIIRRLRHSKPRLVDHSL